MTSWWTDDEPDPLGRVRRRRAWRRHRRGRAIAGDADPSPLLGNLPGSIRHRSRIEAPAIRRGWLENGPGPTDRRGADEFVAVSWDELTELLAAELRRVVDDHGNEAIYGGSYGWASAGRFHHAQSQVHRFLNLLAAIPFRGIHTAWARPGVIMPHVVGTHDDLFKRSTEWPVIADNTDLMVCFGGVALKNSAVNPGGTTEHPTRAALHRLRERGGKVVSFSPLRDDVDGECEWFAPVPGTDVAIMLALAYVLATEGLADRDFLDSYCTGYPRFERYLLGLDDGIVKSPEWAAAISGTVRRRPDHTGPAHGCGAHDGDGQLVTAARALRRAGSVDGADAGGHARPDRLPGGGFGHGYGSQNEVGMPPSVSPPRVPPGNQPGADVHPGRRRQRHAAAPRRDVRVQRSHADLSGHQVGLLGGGNPFHHHQNISRLRRAMGRPDTVVVHDPYWTAMAKHADIVVPSTTPYEREDYSGSRNDPLLLVMPALADPHARSRDDYATFAALAERLGFGEQFTEGRDARQWLVHMYEKWSTELDSRCRRSTSSGRRVACACRPRRASRCWPTSATTPSRTGWARRAGASRSSPRPSTGSGTTTAPAIPRGTSQANGSAVPARSTIPCTFWPISQPVGCTANSTAEPPASPRKCKGAKPIRMHPDDAAVRGLSGGDVVRVFNHRGACLAGLVIDDGLRPSVVQLSTGAWLRPSGRGRPRCDVRARQPERPHLRHRYVLTGTRLHGRTRSRRGGAFHRPHTTDSSTRAAADHRPMTDAIEVRELGRTLRFTFDDALRYAGPGSPAGVAVAFTALQRAFAVLSPTAPPERRSVAVRTPFRGPGARDCFEAVTRAVSDDRYVVDRSLLRVDRGRLLEDFVFEVRVGDNATTLLLRDGFVTDEFIDLARAQDRSPEGERRFMHIKIELAQAIMAAPRDEVFDTE